MRRSFPVLVVVLGAAWLLAACTGSAADPAAARVDSTSISRRELDDQLEVLGKNTKWLTAIAPEFGEEPLTAPNGNVSARFSAAWLTALMNQAVVDAEFERRDLTVSEQNRKDAEAAAESLFNTDQGGTFETMPKWFRDDFVEGQSRYEAVQEVVPDNPPTTEAQLQNMFERSKPQYCPAGNAVSHILLDTQAEADEIVAALARGEDFETLARRSTDVNTSRSGGFLSCTGAPNWTQLPEAFRQAVDLVPVGTTSAPIPSEFGFHVVKVSPFDLANVRQFIDTLYQDSLRPPMTQFINNQLLEAKLWVDPRYGTIARGPVRVDPPTAPETRDRPPLPSTTAPAGTTGP